MRSLPTCRALLVVLGAGCGGPSGDAPPVDDTVETDASGASDAPLPTGRLSPAELAAAFRDVLGVDVDPAAWLVDDPRSRTFAHLDDVTALTEPWIEGYAQLVEAVTSRALARDEVVPGGAATFVVPAEALAWDAGVTGTLAALDEAWWVLQGAGTGSARFEAPPGGPWQGALVASLAPPADGRLRVEVDLDGRSVVALDLGPDAAGDARWAIPWPVASGAHVLSVRVDADGAPPASTWTGGALRTLPDPPYVGLARLELVGPSTPDTARPAAARAALLPCTVAPSTPEDCLGRVLAPVGRRLWRRELTAAEVERVVGLAVAVRTATGDDDRAVAAGLQALLLSPSFLFRLDGVDRGVDAEGRPLRAAAVATRLAFLVTAAPPDDALLDCAAADGLRDDDTPCGLGAQLARLREAAGATAFVDAFLPGWLGTDVAADVHFNATETLHWSPDVVDALAAELRALGAAVVDEDRDLRDLLVADEAWLRFPLGAIYDVDVPGWTPAWTSLGGPDRSGLLTTGVVLEAASPRASPVKRGAWVAQHLLCTPPPAPPADVPPAPPIPADADPNEVFDAHLTDPTCAGCHASFEPYGRVLALYGPLGERLRGPDGAPRTVETTLPGGAVVHDARELAEALRADPRFTTCLVRRYLEWGLGRGLADDDPAIARVEDAAVAGGLTAGALATAVVLDPVFQAEAP